MNNRRCGVRAGEREGRREPQQRRQRRRQPGVDPRALRGLQVAEPGARHGGGAVGLRRVGGHRVHGGGAQEPRSAPKALKP
eukprot:6772232-Pyramimonas_sp.AAC.1